jgi:hypothetical protein
VFLRPFVAVVEVEVAAVAAAVAVVEVAAVAAAVFRLQKLRKHDPVRGV